MKTSYTIPEVAKILYVTEAMVISWVDQGKLKAREENLKNYVRREDLVLFMNRVGFCTLALETSPTEEEELKEWMLKNKDKLYRALEQYYDDGADCSAEYNKMSVLMGRYLEGK